jgi:AcrR family transcriptional regulator
LSDLCENRLMSAQHTRPRGRPRLFDEEATLDALTMLFWEKGYSQTSMADLVDTTGVHKSSLYSTFGNKEELFAKILRRYLATRMEMFAELIQLAGPGIEGIHAFLELLRAEAVSGSSQQGCLLGHTSSELCGTTPGFENFGPEYREAMKLQLRPLISQAGAEDPSLVDERVNVFFTLLLGLDVSNRGGASSEEIGEIIDAMHATVDKWQH